MVDKSEKSEKGDCGVGAEKEQSLMMEADREAEVRELAGMGGDRLVVVARLKMDLGQLNQKIERCFDDVGDKRLGLFCGEVETCCGSFSDEKRKLRRDKTK